jgi:hypothetical protein
VNLFGQQNQSIGAINREDLRGLLLYILPAGLVLLSLSGCHEVSASANANSARTNTPPPVFLVAPAGSVLRVRLDQALDTGRSRPGDRFTGALDSPLFADGREVLPRGTTVHGHVMAAHASGRLKGRAVLSLTLDSCEASGREVAVAVNPVTRVSGKHKKRNWTWIGGGSGTGALIGGLVGGPVGALAGAGSGAAAGTAGAAITGKKQVYMPAETLTGFTLKSPLVVETDT